MKEIASAVTALLAFLIPFGIYCTLLAIINRRNKPMLVPGVWDTLGLLGAMSGFLLWTMPSLLDTFCRQVVDPVEAPELYSALWIIYFVCLAFFSVLMVYLRVGKTVIYNVDTKVFPTLFEQALAKIGLSGQFQRGRWTVTPVKLPIGAEGAFAEKPTQAIAAKDDRRFAEVTLEYFAPMCHVTLHWHQGEAYLRREIEDELERVLELAAPEDNAAAGWFYSISGIIFGAFFMVAAMILFLILFPR